ncbi:MAG: hypothetical protein SH856_13630 [Flavobacteriales bacterium]|nr:hypothetical protein [Flavobacteriales bacterium]
MMWLFALVMLDSCCRCDDPADADCKNYDPCYDKVPWSGEFVMYYQQSTNDYIDYIVDQDSIIFGLGITCEALYLEADSFHWQVGQDPTVYSGSVLSLGFSGPYSNVDVKLTVYGKKEECFPDEPVVKTSTIVIHPVARHDLPIWGKQYTGTFDDNPNETLTTTFYYENLVTWPFSDADWIMSDLPEGCEGVSLSIFSHRSFHIGTTIEPCNTGISDESFGHISTDFKQLSATFVMGTGNGIFTRKFTGTLVEYSCT